MDSRRSFLIFIGGCFVEHSSFCYSWLFFCLPLTRVWYAKVLPNFRWIMSLWKNCFLSSQKKFNLKFISKRLWMNWSYKSMLSTKLWEVLEQYHNPDRFQIDFKRFQKLVSKTERKLQKSFHWASSFLLSSKVAFKTKPENFRTKTGNFPGLHKTLIPIPFVVVVVGWKRFDEQISCLSRHYPVFIKTYRWIFSLIIVVRFSCLCFCLSYTLERDDEVLFSFAQESLKNPFYVLMMKLNMRKRNSIPDERDERQRERESARE